MAVGEPAAVKNLPGCHKNSSVEKAAASFRGKKAPATDPTGQMGSYK